MDNINIYELEGLTLQIPLRYDTQSGKYIEDYTAYMERVVYTPNGFPVMFAGEDACQFSQEDTPGGCPDCGSCRFYKRADVHTWIGICQCEQNKH